MTRPSIDELFTITPSEIVFLCGAGISYDPPARLPTINSFVARALTECKASTKIRHAIRQKVDNGESIARFEVLIDSLRTIYDHSLLVGDVFDTHSYNYTHSFLGQMVLRGSSVITTNFDNCIEHSISPLPVQRVVFDGSDLRYVPPLNKVIAKVHGSNELVSSGKHSELVITISGLATTTDGFAKLPRWKRFLCDLVSRKYVVVLGYSGSDQFDVTPLLGQMRPRQMIWVDHDASRGYPRRTKLISNRNVRALSQTLPINYFRGTLSNFVRKWSLRLPVILKQWKSSSSVYSVRDYVAAVYKSRISRDCLINEILTNYGLFGLIATRKHSRTNATIVLQQIRALYRLGHGKQVLSTVDRYRHLLRTDSHRANVLYYEASSYYQLGESAKAVNAAEAHLKLVSKIGNATAIVHSLNNLGGIYLGARQFTKARKCFRRSLAANRNIISIEARATATWGLANIAVYRKRYKEAYDLYRNAMEMISQLGDEYKIGLLNQSIGVALTGSRKYKLALTHFDLAQVYFSAIQNTLGLTYTLNGLAKLYFQKRAFHKCRDITDTCLALVTSEPHLPMAIEIVFMKVVLCKSQQERTQFARDYDAVLNDIARCAHRDGRLLTMWQRRPNDNVALHDILSRVTY
jgi:tetratricopeptide (TPR) repeat protein